MITLLKRYENEKYIRCKRRSWERGGVDHSAEEYEMEKIQQMRQRGDLKKKTVVFEKKEFLMSGWIWRKRRHCWCIWRSEMRRWRQRNDWSEEPLRFCSPHGYTAQTAPVADYPPNWHFPQLFQKVRIDDFNFNNNLGHNYRPIVQWMAFNT